MSDAFVVETDRQTAGIAVRETRGFRFFAAHRSFAAIDGRVFPHLRAVHRAVDDAAPAPNLA